MFLQPADMSLLLLLAGEPVSETITLALPENVVQGSERAYVSFLGEQPVCLRSGHLGNGEFPGRKPFWAIFSFGKGCREQTRLHCGDQHARGGRSA